MVILISAVGSSGKTLMAQKLLEKYKIPYLSLDHLKMGLYRGNDDCRFTPEDDDDVIAEHLWPIVKGMIMTNIENEQHMIVEGCYILPKHMHDFSSEYAEKIIPVFFGFSPNYIEENYTSAILENRDVIEQRGWPEDRSVADFIKEHLSFKRKCVEAGVPYFEVNSDYQQEILRVYDYIEKEKQRIDSLS